MNICSNRACLKDLKQVQCYCQRWRPTGQKQLGHFYFIKLGVETAFFCIVKLPTHNTIHLGLEMGPHNSNQINTRLGILILYSE